MPFTQSQISRPTNFRRNAEITAKGGKRTDLRGEASTYSGLLPKILKLEKPRSLRRS